MFFIFFILILMNIANLSILLLIHKDFKHYFYCLEYMIDSINIHIIDLESAIYNNLRKE